ncbi:MAG: response regulator [Desulfobacteraceae bacterium]|nr:response regulator [Desulfobacteraceae bacterium]
MDKPHKILIIDDNEELLDALCNFFSMKKYAVKCASNGLEGLKIIESEIDGLDLLITDPVMRKVSGVGIISIMKKKNPKIPVVAITGWGEFPEALAEEARADRILKKPFELEELLGVVEDLIKNR